MITLNEYFPIYGVFLLFLGICGNTFSQFFPCDIRHMLQNSTFVRSMFLFFTLLTWVLGFLILTYLNFNISLDHSIIKVTFIGLAALTFPHMILVDLYFRPSLKI